MVLSASADGACTLANAVRPLKKKKSHGVRSPLCSCSCPASLICALPVDALCAEAIPHRLQPQARRISHARQHQRRSACSLPAFVLPLLIRRPPATRHSRSQGHKAHRQSGSCVFRGRRLVVCLVGRGRHLPSRLASQPSTELSGGVGDGLRIGQGRLGRKGVVWQATFWWGCSSRHGRRRGGRRLRSRNELAMPLNPKSKLPRPRAEVLSSREPPYKLLRTSTGTLPAPIARVPLSLRSTTVCSSHAQPTPAVAQRQESNGPLAETRRKVRRRQLSLGCRSSRLPDRDRCSRCSRDASRRGRRAYVPVVRGGRRGVRGDRERLEGRGEIGRAHV